jgi:tungstate transport system permease protein
MMDFQDAMRIASDLVAGLDGRLGGIVLLSLGVSLTAVSIAGLIGVPLGALLAISRFRGRAAIVVAVNGLLGLPPVVVGLAVYVLLSRAGPLGPLGLLFTPGAMIIAQTILVAPIIVALTHRTTEALWADYGDALQLDGASRLRCVPVLLAMSRGALLTTLLAGFGRAISEVGAILVVGGNIAGITRTMTTTIALETSKGDLALALGLGAILVGICLAISTASFIATRSRSYA